MPTGYNQKWFISATYRNWLLISQARIGSFICRLPKIWLYLFIDGARMGYGLAAPDNDLSLADIAQLCDVFYIGGTKCGALFGEAVVIINPLLKRRLLFHMQTAELSWPKAAS